jgi:hypothetical protein
MERGAWGSQRLILGRQAGLALGSFPPQARSRVERMKILPNQVAWEEWPYNEL